MGMIYVHIIYRIEILASDDDEPVHNELKYSLDRRVVYQL